MRNGRLKVGGGGAVEGGGRGDMGGGGEGMALRAEHRRGRGAVCDEGEEAGDAGAERDVEYRLKRRRSRPTRKGWTAKRRAV